MTLAELALKEVLRSSDSTINDLFPLLFDSNTLLPSWIYQHVSVWWLEYNRKSIMYTIFRAQDEEIERRSFNRMNTTFFFSEPSGFAIPVVSLPWDCGPHIYNFALTPQSHQPPGHINFNRISTLTYYFETSCESSLVK